MWNDPYNDPPDSSDEDNRDKKREEDDEADSEPVGAYGYSAPVEQTLEDTTETDLSEQRVPGYQFTDSRWESQFDSAQMVKVTRNRLARLQRAMPLEQIKAGALARGIAFLLDAAITLLLAGGPFWLEKQGYLDNLLPDMEIRTLVLIGHGAAALIYYRLFFALLGGRSFGRVVAGTRLVDGAGRFLKGIQALVHTILQTVSYIPPLFIINGLVAALRKDQCSLIDVVLNTREVKESAWFQLAQKSIYRDDVSKLGE